MKSFSARIFKLGINPCVDVPQNVLEELFRRAGKTKGPIPVRGKLNGKPFIQTVVKYQGAWRLYLNMQMRRDAGADVGDITKVKIDFDSKPRIFPMHPELIYALSKNKKVKTLFDKLAHSRQEEIVRYLNSLKKEESVKRIVTKIIQRLSAG